MFDKYNGKNDIGEKQRDSRIKKQIEDLELERE